MESVRYYDFAFIKGFTVALANNVPLANFIMLYIDLIKCSMFMDRECILLLQEWSALFQFIRAHLTYCATLDSQKTNKGIWGKIVTSEPWKMFWSRKVGIDFITWPISDRHDKWRICGFLTRGTWNNCFKKLVDAIQTSWYNHVSRDLSICWPTKKYIWNLPRGC